MTITNEEDDGVILGSGTVIIVSVPSGDSTPDKILASVSSVTDDIEFLDGRVNALRRNRLAWYRQGQRRGVSFRHLGQAAGCSAQAVSAMIKRADKAETGGDDHP